VSISFVSIKYLTYPNVQNRIRAGLFGPFECLFLLISSLSVAQRAQPVALYKVALR
jgi:hypothetical protein